MWRSAILYQLMFAARHPENKMRLYMYIYICTCIQVYIDHLRLISVLMLWVTDAVSLCELVHMYTCIMYKSRQSSQMSRCNTNTYMIEDCTSKLDKLNRQTTDLDRRLYRQVTGLIGRLDLDWLQAACLFPAVILPSAEGQQFTLLPREMESAWHSVTPVQ